MSPSAQPKPPESETRNAERDKRRKHCKDTSGFIWGTWLMLFLGIVLGHDTLQGFRSGEWVDIGVRPTQLLVPWWLSAILALVALLLSLMCFGEYVKLKMTAPAHQPGDEDNGNV